jgi:hypothetical protein
VILDILTYHNFCTPTVGKLNQAMAHHVREHQTGVLKLKTIEGFQPMNDQDFTRNINTVAEEDIPFKDLSPLKQKRLLTKANKQLKKAGLPPLTRKDMEEQDKWSILTDLYKEIGNNIARSLLTLRGVIESEYLPDEIRDSKDMGKLRRRVAAIQLLLVSELQSTYDKHKDKTGVIRLKDTALALEIHQKYVLIQNSFIEHIAYIGPIIEIIVPLIKLAKEQTEHENEDGNMGDDTETV